MPDAEPVDRGDHRLVDGGEGLHEPDRGFAELRLVDVFPDFLGVLPGGEDARHPGDDHRADAGVAFGERDRVGRHVEHLAGERVAHLRTVEANGLHAVAHVDRNVVIHPASIPCRNPPPVIAAPATALSLRPAHAAASAPTAAADPTMAALSDETSGSIVWAKNAALAIAAEPAWSSSAARAPLASNPAANVMAKIRRYALAPSSAAAPLALVGLGDERRRRAEFGGGLRDRIVHGLEFEAAGHLETIGDPGEFRCDGVHRGAVPQMKLARDEVDRLDAVGALVDREDPRVAEMLRGAGLLDVAGAAMDLDAERGDLDRRIGREGLGDRGQEARPVGPAGPLRRPARAGSCRSRGRRRSRAPAMRRPATSCAAASSARRDARRSGSVPAGAPGALPCRRSRA